ncbi:arsenate reductase family protein [Confluentibacter citreus]|uniref:arsenate reductase family protein n=1 Tax=Confluentibacter citreus TaxID=2007307 RepID=UPI000C28375D|nr:hypothetical protein [Confluentibacter citreus]
MGVLATDDKELIYIYSNQSNLGKKVLAYAQSSDKVLRAINIDKEKISDTIWLEIADMVNKPLAELFSPELTDSHGIDNALDYNTDDLLKIVNKNPSLLQYPIAINGKKAISIKDRYDFFKFYKKDGSNFDKSPEAIKNGEHVDTTGDDDDLDDTINF